MYHLFLWQTAAGVIDKLLSATKMVDRMFASFGLVLNYAVDKAAAMLQLRGTDSRQVQSKVLSEDGGLLVVDGCNGPINLSVVSSYRYLGALHVPNGSLGPEASNRVKSQKAKQADGLGKILASSWLGLCRKRP